MKKIYFILFVVLAPFLVKAQCGVQVQHTNELCNNSCSATAQAFATGQSPFTYMWLPGSMTTQSVTGLCPGSYTVIITDANNCAATATFTVTQPPPLMVATSPTAASCASCCDGFIISTVTGGTPPYTYAWSNGQTTPTDQAVCPGSYTLCVTDANACVSCDTTITVSFTSGIQDQSVNGNLSLFPNPAMNFITVKETFSNSVSAEINVYDVLGKTLLTRNVSGKAINENFDLSSFTKGVYFIAVKTDDGTSVQKFVKE